MRKKPGRSNDRFKAVTEGFRRLTPERLESILAKRQKMQMRVSESDKADIAATAKWLQLTATEYLLRLHYLAAMLLAERMGRVPRGRTNR
ncbi:MAG: hypothetical protein NTNFB02_10310 [Nitrospira sp.]